MTAAIWIAAGVLIAASWLKRRPQLAPAKVPAKRRK
jgi:hypothetical protein